MSKRILSFLTALTLLFGLLGCAGGCVKASVPGAAAPAAPVPAATATAAPTANLTLLEDDGADASLSETAAQTPEQGDGLPSPDDGDDELLALEPDFTEAPANTNTPKPTHTPRPTNTPKAQAPINEDGTYTTKDDVALYIHTYGHLPDNFITKREAENLGWPGGGLDDYAYGKCIGGSHFGNYEGALPEKRGRTYTECDIDTLHKNKRGAKRIIFSNDGLIYYTGDHYESFTLLYGEE